jgi:hypothetical protein
MLIRPAPQPTHHSSAVASGERGLETRTRWSAQGAHQERGSHHTPSLHRSKTSDTIVDLGGLFESSHTGYKPHSERSRTTEEPILPQSPFTTKRRYAPEEGRYVAPTSSTTPSMTPGTSHRFCVYCGQDLREDTDFCTRCRRSQK